MIEIHTLTMIDAFRLKERLPSLADVSKVSRQDTVKAIVEIHDESLVDQHKLHPPKHGTRPSFIPFAGIIHLVDT